MKAHNAAIHLTGTLMVSALATPQTLFIFLQHLSRTATSSTQAPYFGSTTRSQQPAGRAVGKTLSNVLLPGSLFFSKNCLQKMGNEDGRYMELAYVVPNDRFSY
jgi:hypothetical protein